MVLNVLLSHDTTSFLASCSIIRNAFLSSFTVLAHSRMIVIDP